MYCTILDKSRVGLTILSGFTSGRSSSSEYRHSLFPSFCSLLTSNELHRSKGLGYHSTVFGFVQGGRNLFLQCWAAHIFDDGRVDVFFDVDRELLGQEMTPVNCK